MQKSTRTSIGPDDNSKGRVVHDTELVEGLRALDGVSGLRAVALLHGLLGVEVVVCRILLLSVNHAVAGPFGTESSGLDACERDVPRCSNNMSSRMRIEAIVNSETLPASMITVLTTLA